MSHDPDTLIDRLETEPRLTDAELDGIAGRIRGAFPDREVFPDAASGALGSSDAILALLARALPSWSIHITGHSASVAGRWTCTIRETGVRDDDELIGVGKAETLPHAILAALLKVVDLRAGRG